MQGATAAVHRPITHDPTNDEQKDFVHVSHNLNQQYALTKVAEGNLAPCTSDKTIIKSEIHRVILR